MHRDVFASSATCEWATPQELFERLNAQYHFETDVYATAENAKCGKFYTKEQDGLKQIKEGGETMRQHTSVTGYNITLASF